jgi:hypothetical protein
MRETNSLRARTELQIMVMLIQGPTRKLCRRQVLVGNSLASGFIDLFRCDAEAFYTGVV